MFNQFSPTMWSDLRYVLVRDASLPVIWCVAAGLLLPLYRLPRGGYVVGALLGLLIVPVAAVTPLAEASARPQWQIWLTVAAVAIICGTLGQAMRPTVLGETATPSSDAAT